MKVRGSISKGASSATNLKTGSIPDKKDDVRQVREVSPKEGVFTEALIQTADDLVTAELDEILKGIDSAGSAFLGDPTFPNLLRYKDLVRSFMKLVLERLYRVKEVTGRRITERQKVYILIETVDQKLDELTASVLESQSKPLALSAKLDEIRGLLLDLYK